MRNFFYPRLAMMNIKKNGKIYTPYLLTGTFMIAMYYIIKSIVYNTGIDKMPDARDVRSIIGVGVAIVAVFTAIFLFYTNSFLMKRRKKELGLYNVLGLGKRHLVRMMICEMVIVAVGTIGAGIVSGMVLSKLIFLILLKIVRVTAPLEFMIEPRAIVETLGSFAVIYAVILLFNVWQVMRVNTIELLHGTYQGEKEPKTRFLLTLVGVVTLGAGYYIAFTVEQPLAAITMFFVAVVLVIIGTYALFAAGSIAFLKLLRRNKKYYYRTNHFISVSGMIYRMKQNAAGLANICILSTMVLVAVSTTVAMYWGMEDIMLTRFPYDFTGVIRYADDDKMEAFRDMVEEETKKLNVEFEQQISFQSASYLTKAEGENSLSVPKDTDDYTSYVSLGMIVKAVPLSDYNRVTGENKTLKEDEILVYRASRNATVEVKKGDFTFGSKNFRVKEVLDAFIESGNTQMNALDTLYIIVKDRAVVADLWEISGEPDVIGELQIDGELSYDFKGDKKTVKKLTDALAARFGEMNLDGYVEVREDHRAGFYSFYGGFLFLGIFFGILFLVATVLIIYYKQISEGYDDRERFQIMQKVGMSKREVKKAIHSQVISVFALPIVAAIIHICVAFRVIFRLLVLLNLKNEVLFRNCTIITIGVFSIIYVIVYLITAREYYRIVN
ncbi:ABC transporter permease [Roseburia hominis]